MAKLYIQGARLFSSFHEPEITAFIWDTRIKGNQPPRFLGGFHSTGLAKSQHNSIHAFRQILGTGTATSPAEKKQDAREICPGRDKAYCRRPNLGLVELRQILGADPGEM